MFLKESKNEDIKGRACTYGSKKGKATSTTA